MTLDEAHDDFRAKPTPASAAVYLETLMTYEADDMIGDDTFHNGLGEIQAALEKMPNP